MKRKEIDWFTEKWQKHLLHRHTVTLTHTHGILLTFAANRSHSDSIRFDSIWLDLIHCTLGLNRTLCDAAWITILPFHFGFWLQNRLGLKNILCDYVKEKYVIIKHDVWALFLLRKDFFIHSSSSSLLFAFDCIRLFHWISPLLFIRIDLSFSMHTKISIHQLQ